MITSIKNLKSFGIFRDNTTVENFGKYNLFYGWNGSGKSTLSSLFRCIETQNLEKKFSSAEFTIACENGDLITKSNIAQANLNIYTFNRDFIDENISWNDIVNSILLIDKEKIDERKNLESLKNKQESDKKKYDIEKNNISTLNKKISEFGSITAKKIKTNLQSIDTTDNYYLYYDKTKFENFISENFESIKSGELLLDEKKVIELTNTARPNQKPTINNFNLKPLDEGQLAKAKDRLAVLLESNVTNQIIRRLVDNNDINQWVQTGLELHQSHNVEKCEFCGSDITEARIKQLEAHFNDEYTTFQTKLKSADKWLFEQYIQKPELPEPSNLYDELRDKYNSACSELTKTIENVNPEISAWHDVLRKKINNPFETGLTVDPINELSINMFNKCLTSINNIINKHNNKTNNFKEETEKAKKQLELHYAKDEIQPFQYYNKKQELEELTKNNTQLNNEISEREQRISGIERTLSNENLAAEQFNRSLQKFIGREELALRFNRDKKGYEILRNGSDLVSGNLSEGEKTAIAFVYFITKLKENDNKIQDTIIVVDDPVSSFDSNHLFQAYSFLRNNCSGAKQLFVLTHNLTYFRLIRDWFDTINKNRNKRNPPKEKNAFFYTIEALPSTPRTSHIFIADDSLINYNSEYHNIFSKLYKFKDKQKLSPDEAFLTANLSRKLLESFFSFKYPKHRADIAQLMSAGLNNCQKTDEITKEKIYRFINKYSHSVTIEVNEDASENLMGESQYIIRDIFAWLEEVDKVHYDEMIEVVS